MYEVLAAAALDANDPDRVVEAVLRARERHPDLSDEELADKLTARAALACAAVGAVAPASVDLTYQALSLHRLILSIARVSGKPATPLERASAVAGSLLVARERGGAAGRRARDAASAGGSVAAPAGDRRGACRGRRAIWRRASPGLCRPALLLRTSRPAPVVRGDGADVVIVGGGVIGCALARELAMRGAAVTVVEKAEPGAEASGAAAGLLAPQAEGLARGPFFDLALESRRLYPAWTAAIEEESGMEVG